MGGLPVPEGGPADYNRQYCGKAIFTDVHAGHTPSGALPGSCAQTPLTPQEMALEFLFFDFSACVQDSPVLVSPPPL